MKLKFVFLIMASTLSSCYGQGRTGDPYYIPNAWENFDTASEFDLSRQPQGTALYTSHGPFDVPANAIAAGVSVIGQVYVGFVKLNSAVSFPAQILARNGSMFYPPHKLCNQELEKKTDVKYLVIKKGYSYEWVPTANGYIPENAAKLGQSSPQLPYYVGRLMVNFQYRVGRISNNYMKTSADGKCYQKNHYDILVIKKNF